MMCKRLLFRLWKDSLRISLFLFFPLFAEQCPALLNEPQETKTFGEMRVKTLKGWDKLLTWALSPQYHPYPLKSPLEEKRFLVDAEDLLSFNSNYGYFSIHHPIVGLVTKEERDTAVTNCLLESIHLEVNDLDQRRFSTDEILAKVMAFRTLEKGMKISLSTLDSVGNSVLEMYIVDQVIDLWRGMPAFGLVPVEKGASTPILLFRGTDLSLTSEKGWASILSDLDISGPGHKTFLKAQARIREWLEKMHEQKTPARIIGFSLGGVFVLYTLIYQYDLINLDPNLPSVAFNPSGVSKEMLFKWNELSQKVKPPHISYVNQGDFVSKLGFLLSNVWEISLDHPMQVIEAHLSIISTQPFYQMSRVNVLLENQARK